MLQNKRKMRRVAVMGIGNLLLKDDGIGVHAINKLRETGPFPEDIDLEIMDCGTAPDVSIYLDNLVDKLIIVDAVRAGGRPGSIYRLTPDVLESERHDIISAHDLNLRTSIFLMRIAGTLPVDTIIIGVEPGEMGWGVTLTAEVSAILPELVVIIRREITL